MVFGAVAFIEISQPLAGKVLAFIAEAHKTFPQQVTVLFHEGAVLAAWQTAGTVLLRKSLLVQVICHRQIADA